MTLSTLSVAAVALSALPGAFANALAKRNYEPHYPPCTSSYVPFVYVGCYNDPDGNTLPFSPQPFLDKDDMTVEDCTAACKGNGFRYAGLEYYGQCRCGTNIGNTPASGTGVDGQCTYACTGDSTEICGGSNLISIYVDPTFPIVDLTNAYTGYVSLGCYAEVPGRALSLPQDDLSAAGTVTQELCIARCGSIGAAYAGVEYGRECYCSPTVFSSPVDPSNCNVACVGANPDNELCGGSGYVQVYYNSNLDSNQHCGDSPSGSTTPVPTPTPTPSVTTSSSPPATTSSTSPTVITTPPSSTSPSTTSQAPPPSTTSQAPPTSTCIYRCGNYCQPALPTYSDAPSCKVTAGQCWSHVKQCWAQAGSGYTDLCKNIAHKCAIYSTYCNIKCNGNGPCNKGDCDNNWYGPTTRPPVPPSTPTYHPVPPTYTPTTPTYGICTTPAAYANAIGGYKAPVVQCNNNYQDYNSGKCWKIFNSKLSSYYNFGNTFYRQQAGNACTQACQMQYANCRNQYATTCITKRMGRRNPQEAHEMVARTFGWFWPWLKGGVSDSYMGALSKCQQQRNACIQANQNNNGNGRCPTYGHY